MAFFTYKDKKIFYEFHGEGEVVLLLNGLMMTTKSWMPIKRKLSKYKVVMVDFIDQGSSTSWDQDYGIDLQVDVVKGLVEALDLKKINIMGISYGGKVAMSFASQYGNVVNSVIAINSIAQVTESFQDILDSWSEAALTFDGGALFECSAPYVYSEDYRNDNVRLMELTKEFYKNITDEQWYRCLFRMAKSLENLDLSEQLGQIEAPTLIVSGEMDALAPLEEQRKVHMQIKHSDHGIIKGCGHGATLEKPKELLELAERFWSSVYEGAV